jgi:hypothetical protein
VERLTKSSQNTSSFIALSKKHLTTFPEFTPRNVASQMTEKQSMNLHAGKESPSSYAWKEQYWPSTDSVLYTLLMDGKPYDSKCVTTS